MGQAALAQRLIDDVHSPLHKALLIRILDAEDKFAAQMPGDQIGISAVRRLPTMHVACGRRGKAGPDLPAGDPRLHLLKEIHIQCHTNTSGY